ncbi:MAG: TrbG/VirB9 family P-type conjugative transfer protein [Acidithiobacillus sp.]
MNMGQIKLGTFVNLKKLVPAIIALPCVSIASPSGHWENTAQAWSSHGAVRVEHLKQAERDTLAAYANGHIRNLPILANYAGTMAYPYGQITPLLQTMPGVFSQVILGKGVHPVSMVGAPGSEWVTNTHFAAGHPVLEIMPLHVGLHANVQISAESPHGHLLTYTIGLVSGNGTYTPTLTFYREPAYHKPSIQEVARLAAQEALNPIANATEVSTDWKVSCYNGDCSGITPISVLNSKTATFLKLPAGANPMVLVREKDGLSVLVHTQMNGDTLVVGAVPYRIDLMSHGKGGNINLVRVTRGEP